MEEGLSSGMINPKSKAIVSHWTIDKGLICECFFMKSMWRRSMWPLLKVQGVVLRDFYISPQNLRTPQYHWQLRAGLTDPRTQILRCTVSLQGKFRSCILSQPHWRRVTSSLLREKPIFARSDNYFCMSNFIWVFKCSSCQKNMRTPKPSGLNTLLK